MQNDNWPQPTSRNAQAAYPGSVCQPKPATNETTEESAKQTLWFDLEVVLKSGLIGLLSSTLDLQNCKFQI
jgi:hypothetical protein